MNDLKSRNCSRCSETLSSIYNDFLCLSCKYSDLYEKLSIESQEEIDKNIYDHRNLYAIEKIKEELIISLPQSINLFQWRCDKLKEITPNKFKKS